MADKAPKESAQRNHIALTMLVMIVSPLCVLPKDSVDCMPQQDQPTRVDAREEQVRAPRTSARGRGGKSSRGPQQEKRNNPQPPTMRSGFEPDRESTRSGATTTVQSRKSSGGKSSGSIAARLLLVESKQWSKMFVVTAAIAVIVLGVMTLVTSRWVSTSPQGLTRGSSRPTTWGFNADYWLEIGFWSSCNCTTLDSGPTCATRTSKMRAVQGFTTLTVLSHIFALFAFVISSFISFSMFTEIAIVGGFATSALMAVLSWIVCVVLLLDDGCGMGSFASQGFTLHWAFGLRVAESVGLSGLCAMCVMRLKGLINQWPLVMMASITLLVFGVASTTSHLWFHSSSADSVNTGADVEVGPFAICSCVDSSTACSAMTSRFQGIQAVALIHLLVAVPVVVVLILSWVSWVVDVTKWGLAIGVFTTCKCPIVEASSFSWPVAVAIIEFLLQSGLSVTLSVTYAKQRLVDWHTSNIPHFLESGDKIDAGPLPDLRSIYDDGASHEAIPTSLPPLVEIPLAPRRAVSKAELENLQRPVNNS